MIQTSLIAGNTSVDFFRTSLCSFVDKIFISQKWTGHRDHVRQPVSQETLCHIRIVYAVGSHDRNIEMRTQPACYPGKCCTGNHHGNCRNPCFMPADSGIDQRRSCLFYTLSKFNNFLKTASIFN